VNVTFVPWQIVEDAFEEIVNDGTTTGATLIVRLLLVAEVGEAHPALLVSTHEMTSPFARLLAVNVLLLDPVLTPFLFH
jgi:hypothetical protein